MELRVIVLIGEAIICDILSVFIAFGNGFSLHGLRTLLYLLDPNEPLFPKIVIVSVGLIVGFLVYKFRNRKNRNKDTAKEMRQAKPIVGIKICPYCGAKYTSDKTACAIDQSRLVPR
jgi:hypothetical protein